MTEDKIQERTVEAAERGRIFGATRGKAMLQTKIESVRWPILDNQMIPTPYFDGTDEDQRWLIEVYKSAARSAYTDIQDSSITNQPCNEQKK